MRVRPVPTSLSLLALSLTALPACSASRANEPTVQASSAPSELPDLPVTPLDGGAPLGLREAVKGKVAVIDLWATWCTACREVTKNVELLHRSKQGTDLVVIGLDVGEERSVVESFLEGRKPAYAIYLDPKLTVADRLHQTELPAVIVVDRTGAIRMVRNRIDPAMLGLVDHLLAEGGPAAPAAPSAPLMTAPPAPSTQPAP